MAFKADMGGVRAKVQRIITDRGLGMLLATDAEKGMRQYVPQRTGYLMDSASSKPFKVTYNAPYARYPFYGRGMRINTQQKPNATSRWDRAYGVASGQALADAGTKYIRSM